MNISLGEYEAFKGELEGLKEVGFKTASFYTDEYEFYFDLELMKCVKYRKLDQDNYEDKDTELLDNSISLIILYEKTKPSFGFSMEG